MTLSLAKKIAPSDWMLLPECRSIMRVLNGEATEPQALFVGGCVRNILIEKPVDDLDIATVHLPQDVIELCKTAGFKTFPTGIDHGTVTVVIGKQSFEVTTLRRDVATDGRRATVAFSSDWCEDAARRDFTMNTLLADLMGNIYDPTKRGIEDLEAGKVIFVGDAAQRIKEDTLRILRFFRFHAYYGDGVPNQEALKACAALSGHIPELSRERIIQEFSKILMSNKAAETLELMKQNNVLSDILPDDFSAFERLVRRQNEFDLNHLESRYYCLFGSSYERLNALSDTYFIYSNAQKKFYETIEQVKGVQDLKDVKKLVYFYGSEVVLQAVLMHGNGKIEPMIELIQNWDVPVFPLSGEDAKAAGFVQGKAMGDALKNVETWWVAQDFMPDKAQCILQLKQLLS